MRLAKPHGFIGTLGVSEISITLPEYLEFLAVCKDEAARRASWARSSATGCSAGKW